LKLAERVQVEDAATEAAQVLVRTKFDVSDSVTALMTRAAVPVLVRVKI
jgi:predicted transcriptional regulator